MNALDLARWQFGIVTLRIMTWVAVAFTPIVLLYQGWTYWVFRQRIGVTPATAVRPRERDRTATG